MNRQLVAIYIKLFSLGLIFVLILHLLISNYVAQSESSLNYGHDIIPKVEASYDLEITPDFVDSKKFVKKSPISTHNFSKYQMTIINVTGREMDYFYFTQNPPQISSVGKNNSCKVAINGSYFAGKRQNANHVGLLSIWGKRYVPLGVERQLTHVTVYDKESKTVKFLKASDYISRPRKNIIEFQTGPLVLHNDIVQNSFIRNSKNGLEKHKRMLLATNDRNQTFIIVVRERVDLVSLAKYLKRIGLLGSGLNAINLDGGSSVALWNQNAPGTNYNSKATLPLVICVR